MNTTIDDGGPAFPNTARPMAGEMTEWGMSLRAWLAGKALQGLLSNPGGPIQANGMSGWDFTNCTPSNVVSLAIGLADATIEALKGEEAA